MTVVCDLPLKSSPIRPSPAQGGGVAWLESARGTRLCDDDEKTITELVKQLRASMLRVARTHVSSREAAEDVVQDTWVGVMNGLNGFEQRSSLKTWIFSILVNRAKTRGDRDSRSRPFSSLGPDGDEHSIDSRQCHASGNRGSFRVASRASDQPPEDHVLGTEVREQLTDAIDQLPECQREVIVMRDVHGLPAAEVCELLQLTDANQRVLLHRARSNVRSRLENYLHDTADAN
jgi:RNA polymerase sigma-70 factor, ECF subfamily